MFVSLYLINGLASIISLYLMCEMSIDLHINCSLSPSPSPLITLFLVFVFLHRWTEHTLYCKQCTLFEWVKNRHRQSGVVMWSVGNDWNETKWKENREREKKQVWQCTQCLCVWVPTLWSHTHTDTLLWSFLIVLRVPALLYSHHHFILHSVGKLKRTHSHICSMTGSRTRNWTNHLHYLRQ